MSSDISSDLTYIFSLLAQGVQFCLSFLSSIEFLGTNLLNFMISILILLSLLPIVFSLLRNRIKRF